MAVSLPTSTKMAKGDNAYKMIPWSAGVASLIFHAVLGKEAHLTTIAVISVTWPGNDPVMVYKRHLWLPPVTISLWRLTPIVTNAPFARQQRHWISEWRLNATTGNGREFQSNYTPTPAEPCITCSMPTLSHSGSTRGVKTDQWQVINKLNTSTNHRWQTTFSSQSGYVIWAPLLLCSGCVLLPWTLSTRERWCWPIINWRIFFCIVRRSTLLTS